MSKETNIKIVEKSESSNLDAAITFLTAGAINLETSRSFDAYRDEKYVGNYPSESEALKAASKKK